MFYAIGRVILAALVAVSVSFSGLSPAVADGLTEVQLAAPTVTAEPGQNDGEIVVTVTAGSGNPDGQLFDINVYDNTNSVVWTGNAYSSGGFTNVGGLLADIDYTVVATALAWEDLTNNISYLVAYSEVASTRAYFSPPPPPPPTPMYVVWMDSSLGEFYLGTSYSDSVMAASDFPVTYSIISGQLPAGISLDESGSVSGTPTDPGIYSFEIEAASYPNSVTQTYSGEILSDPGVRGCESYTGASYATNILLNQDGTVIGCDYENQPTDLRPENWESSFAGEFGSLYSTRLGYACDDCSVGASGATGWSPEQNPDTGPGIPIGFDLNFFGTTYSEIFVNSNGSVAFGHGSAIYNQPLNLVLGGAAGIAPFAVDLDNRDVSDYSQAWGPETERHADFFYWGRTTYEGKSAFVVTWMNSQIYPNNDQKDFNTFQIVIVNNGSGDADYILNYGSTQDLKSNAGYRAFDEGGPTAYTCDFTTCLAAGFGSNNGESILYASLLDSTGHLYNGSDSAESLDGASHALNQATLNSEVPGQFIYHMVNGYVPEVAVVPSQPLNFSANANYATVDATWDAPASIGGSPIVSYDIRYRPVDSTDPYVVVNETSRATTITDLLAGTYVFQVAARNEIGIGPFSRSYLVNVVGAILTELTSYDEAVSFAHSLSESHFTPETWSILATALATTVSAENTQLEVDIATANINNAISGLVVASGTIYSVNYEDYDLAVAFANTLREADYTPQTWVDLANALAVDRATLTDQTMVDAQTAAINGAVNNLTLAGAGSVLQLSDLSVYANAVAYASHLNSTRYTSATWAVLVSALSVPITRFDSQTVVDDQVAAIISAFMELIDLSSHNFAVRDASQYLESGYSPASWSALQAALSVSVSNAETQATVDAATDAIYSAINALVPFADMTDYNAAVSNANALSENDYTPVSWTALTNALAIAVNPETDSQIFVDIATQNIVSGIASLVSSTEPPTPADMTQYDSVMGIVDDLVEGDFPADAWATFEATVASNQRTSSDSQADVDESTNTIYSAGMALFAAQSTADFAAYNDARDLALSLAQADYTSSTWNDLQTTLTNYARYPGDSHSEVNIATDAIRRAISGLVSTPPIPVLANMTAYNAALALAATKAQLAYTAISWVALQNAITGNVRVSTESQSRVDASTAAILAAINALVLATPAAPEPKTIHLLIQKQVVSLVKKYNVPVMVGASISAAIKFANNSSKLTKTTTKAITKLAAKWKTQSGWILITGFVNSKSKSSKVLKLAAARALTVAKLLFKLGVGPEIGYYGFGSPNTKKLSSANNKVLIRWSAQ